MVGRRRRGDADSGMSSELDAQEIEARVCELICRGIHVRKIKEELAAATPPIHLNRAAPYNILHNAAKSGRLRYLPTFEMELALRLRERHDWLTSVDVIHSTSLTDIASKTADRLFSLISATGPAGRPKEDFHIGFAGGGLLHHTARLLADKFRLATRALPARIFFHAMVARFDEDPATDPNSFVGYFISGPPLPVQTRFIGLMAPGLVSVESATRYREMEGIRESYERVAELDLVVTSAGGHWQTGCSRLHELYDERNNRETLALLDAAGCVGDLMWRPVGPSGPIELTRGARAMTLIELSALPSLIARGMRAVLVIGPCVSCHRPKTQLLHTVLSLKHHLITDLIVDSVTAREVMLAGGG